MGKILRYSSWAIRWKFAFLVGLLVLALVGGLSAHFINSNTRSARDSLENKVRTVAGMLAWNLQALVDAAAVTGDLSPVEEILKSARGDSELVALRLDDANGKPLLKIGERLDAAAGPAPEELSLDYRNDLLLAAMPLGSGESRLGVLRLAYSLTEFQARQKQLMLSSLLTSALVWLIGLLLAFFIGDRLSRPLVMMTGSFKQMSQGDLNRDPLRQTSDDEIGQLTEAFNGLQKQLRDLSRLAQAIAEGQLAMEITVQGDLARAFRKMKEAIVGLTSEFNRMSNQMERRVSEILATVKEQEASSAQQAAATVEVTSTMEELAATAQQIAHNADSVTRSAEEAGGAVADGRESLFAFVRAMNSIETGNRTINDNILGLNRHVQQIRGIIDIINNIADRTDLLALNAALEGTKAGEAGKGFLLVAAEMRRLAENVLNSTAEIKQLITQVTEATNATVMANESGMRATAEGMDRASMAEHAFERVVNTIEATTRAAKQISLAIQQQHTGTEQVLEAMSQVSSAHQHNLEGIKNISRSIGELSSQANQLRQLVQRYRVSSEGTEAAGGHG